MAQDITEMISMLLFFHVGKELVPICFSQDILHVSFFPKKKRLAPLTKSRQSSPFQQLKSVKNGL